MGLYVALIYSDESAWTSADDSLMNEVMEGHTKFGTTHEPVLRGGHALEPASTATTLRKGPGGEVSVTDGPFAETKEALGGFYAIEAPDLDAAIRIAQDIPMPFGGVEVRPVRVFE